MMGEETESTDGIEGKTPGHNRGIKINDVAKELLAYNQTLAKVSSQINGFKHLTDHLNGSTGATMSLMKAMDSQTSQLKGMFSMQEQLTEALKPAKGISDTIKKLAHFSDSLPKFEVPKIAMTPVVSQLPDMSEAFHEMHRAQAEEKRLRRSGVEAQIESAKILAEQSETIEVLTEAMNALLKHNLEQSKQQAQALQARDVLESQRYSENTRISRIAAWASVISVILSVILAAIGIGVQLYLTK